HLNMDASLLKSVLKKLTDNGKIQLLHDGKYDIKLSDEEMKHITPDEQKALDQIKKGGISAYYDLDDIDDPKFTLRMLVLKGKIYLSRFGGNYKIAKSIDEPLSALEKSILSYLKKWPVTDMFTLYALKRKKPKE